MFFFFSRKNKNKDSVYFVLSTKNQERYKGDTCKAAAEKNPALIIGNNYDPCNVSGHHHLSLHIRGKV